MLVPARTFLSSVKVWKDLPNTSYNWLPIIRSGDMFRLDGFEPSVFFDGWLSPVVLGREDPSMRARYSSPRINQLY